jgi:hypothetical protein
MNLLGLYKQCSVFKARDKGPQNKVLENEKKGGGENPEFDWWETGAPSGHLEDIATD